MFVMGNMVCRLTRDIPLFFDVSWQRDKDMDGIGDVCDTSRDRDSDGVQDGKDNCERVPNSDQLDTDGDSYGQSLQQCCITSPHPLTGFVLHLIYAACA